MTVTDFITVFTAVFMAEVAKIFFERYFRKGVEKNLDTVEKIVLKKPEEEKDSGQRKPYE